MPSSYSASAARSSDRAVPTWPGREEETIGAAEVDSVRAVERRLTRDVAGHYHRPAVFRFVVSGPWGGGATAGVTHS